MTISIHAPRGGSDPDPQTAPIHPRYFNPRSPWGERLDDSKPLRATLYISIHAPRGGSDRCRLCIAMILVLFQSTLPVGGATSRPHWPSWATRYFNPRSPWGERLLFNNFLDCLDLFQSTLPVGGATAAGYEAAKTGLFQSTLPVGGATGGGVGLYNTYKISIHAPRGGSD